MKSEAQLNREAQDKQDREYLVDNPRAEALAAAGEWPEELPLRVRRTF